MRLSLLLCLFFFTTSSSCEEKPESSDIPACMEQIISDLKNAEVSNPPSKVFSYNFNGETVYYIAGPCCDNFSDLYNSNCEIICHPDGGITGKGDGKCPTFSTDATGEKLIWADERM